MDLSLAKDAQKKDWNVNLKWKRKEEERMQLNKKQTTALKHHVGDKSYLIQSTKWKILVQGSTLSRLKEDYFKPSLHCSNIMHHQEVAVENGLLIN